MKKMALITLKHQLKVHLIKKTKCSQFTVKTYSVRHNQQNIAHKHLYYVN